MWVAGYRSPGKSVPGFTSPKRKTNWKRERPGSKSSAPTRMVLSYMYSTAEQEWSAHEVETTVGGSSFQVWEMTRREQWTPKPVALYSSQRMI